MKHLQMLSLLLIEMFLLKTLIELIIFFTEANKTYTEEKDFRTRSMKIAETVRELDKKVSEYQTDGKEALAEKCKQVSDKIRTELLWEQPKYDIIKRFR